MGWLVTVLVVGWLLATRRGAWRGLAFAVAGWSVPTLAVLLNRLERYGPGVADDAIYVYLPTVLVVVGLLEAWRRPRRRPWWRPVTVGPGPRLRRVLLAVPAVVVVAAYAWSAGPTAEYQAPLGTSPAFYEQARDDAEELLARGTPFTVINSDAPWIRR